MSNFPSKWFEFNNHKELRRLRDDFNDTLELKIQIAFSVILAIVSFFIERYISCLKVSFQIVFFVLLCLIVLLIFLLPYIIKKISVRKRCNVLIKGKGATSLFDDEIVYSILVACEYYNSKQAIPDNELKYEIEKFYMLEIRYYITESIKRLSLFTSSCTSIFGKRNNQISIQRVKNIIALIDILLEHSGVELEGTVKRDYMIFCDSIKQI